MEEKELIPTEEPEPLAAGFADAFQPIVKVLAKAMTEHAPVVAVVGAVIHTYIIKGTS